MRPASIVCVLLLLTPGVVALWVPGLAKWGRRWLAALAVVYWTLTTPITVNLLARPLTYGYTRISSPQEVSGAQAIVLLGAGSNNLRSGGLELPLPTITTGLRVLETARLYHMIGSPLVIASGGVTDPDKNGAPESEAMIRALRELGVPADRIVPESRSRNTRDEAIIVLEMLRERGITKFVMVTSATHMRRSMAVFAAQGLHPIPAIAPLTGDRHGPRFGIVPDTAAVWVGDDVVYEWAARVYYWWHGWLSVTAT
jgi:uncharacterized SAM-binding protein YcdF (DUF218 family)